MQEDRLRFIKLSLCLKPRLVVSSDFDLTAKKLKAIQQRSPPQVDPITKELPALDMSLPRLRPWTVKPMSTMHSPSVYHVTRYFWMELRGDSILVIDKSLIRKNIARRY